MLVIGGFFARQSSLFRTASLRPFPSIGGHGAQKIIDRVLAASESFLIPKVFLRYVIEVGVSLIHAEHHASLLSRHILDKLSQMITIRVVPELKNELARQSVLPFHILDLVADGTVDFQHERDDDVEHDQRADDPESREVQAWQSGTRDDAVHISCLIPVVDDKNMEQSHHTSV